MSNTPKLGRSVIPSGDFGLGLCLQCLGAVIADGDDAAQPQFAISLVPMAWPPQSPMGLIAVPACWDHIRTQGEAVRKRPLLLAGNGIG